MTKGYIYIMTNPSLKGMVKIGYATDVEARRKQLSTTALPYDYEIYATYETCGNLEDRILHKMIDNLNPDLRVSKNKEFFVMTPKDAFELLKAIATISGSTDKLHIFDQSKKDKKIKKPSVNFFECNIPIGSELLYVDDNNIKVIVESEHKVIFNNVITSLSAIAKEIKGYNVSGPMYFTYKGKLICDIAEETQWKDL